MDAAAQGRNLAISTCVILVFAVPALIHTQAGPTGTWRADSPGQAAPWEAVLRIEGGHLIGAVSRGFTTSFAAEIYDGTIDGSAVMFSFDLGPRTVKMRGTVAGDVIEFTWESASRPGFNSPDPNDPMFGSAAPHQLTAKRAPDATDRIAQVAAQVRRPPSVTFDRLLRADTEPQNWMSFSRTFDGQRHSLLTQLTPDNVKDLQLAWLWQRSGSPGAFEATPLVVDGVLYTVKGNDVVALNAATGGVLWTFQHTPQPFRAQYGATRGLAILGNTLFWGTLDAHLIAIDAYSGTMLWNTTVANAADPSCKDKDCYSIAHAPLVVKDMVIVGTAGGEGKVRGFIAAFDAASGRERWRFHTVPGPGEPGNNTWSGDSWETGGAPIWNAGSYDPELNLIYWGTGNPAPTQPASSRLGDNLYSDCVVAIDADTGHLKWYYQFTPHDEVDWDATQVPVLADVAWQGVQRKVVLFANRNGLVYVLDRATGELLSGKPFVEINWMSGFDEKGRPIRTRPAPANLSEEFTEKGSLKPGPGEVGATNWYPPSYSPSTGLLYVAALEHHASPRYGAIRAIDPLTGERKWEFKRESAIFESGVLTTASGLLFAGVLGQYSTGAAIDGQFYALDTATGRLLWQATLPDGIKASPITYSVKGKQYVAVTSGNTLFAFRLRQ